MRVLKFFGTILLIFLVILVLLPIILPKNAQVSQSIVIKAKPQTVFRQVNSLKNWRNWSPFELGDSTMKSIYSGPETGKGARHAWKSKDMGDGSMVILQSKPYSFIQSQLDMGSSGMALDEWNFRETENGVEVIWTVKLFNLTYPFGRYFGVFLGSIMQPNQEKGLNKLKEVSESNRESVVIEPLTIISQRTVVIYDSAKISNMHEVVERAYDELFVFMKRSKVKPSGPAFTMYYNWDTTTYIKMAIGFPVFDEAKSNGRVEFFNRPGGAVVKATLYGSYDKLGDAHNDIALYFDDFDLPYSDKPVWEEYVTDPAIEKNTKNWQTNIYYYIGY